MITNLSQNSKQNGMVISVRKRYLSSGYYFSLVFIGHQGTGVGGERGRGALRSKVTGMIKRSKNQTKNIPRASNETPKIPWTENYLFTIPSEFTFFSPGSLELAYAQSTPIVKLFLNTPKKSLLKSKQRKKRPHFLFYKKKPEWNFKPTENPFRTFFNSPKNPT